VVIAGDFVCNGGSGLDDMSCTNRTTSRRTITSRKSAGSSLTAFRTFLDGLPLNHLHLWIETLSARFLLRVCRRP